VFKIGGLFFCSSVASSRARLFYDVARDEQQILFFKTTTNTHEMLVAAQGHKVPSRMRFIY
jgi:hypothetical protein